MLHRRFVIQVYLSTPRIAFISIDLKPNDLNEWVYFRREGVYAHHAHAVLQFGRDRPNKGIRAPKILSKMANINVSDVLWPDYSSVACPLLRMDAHSYLTFALEELAVSRLQSTRTHLSGDWTCKKSHNTCMWETPTPYSQLHSQNKDPLTGHQKIWYR